MDKIAKGYIRAFNAQRHNAKYRGIEFKLTFKEWCDWWGPDIGNRGSGSDQLQMQRYHDKGAYELGNITKGHPKQNSRTAANCKRTKTAQQAWDKMQAALDNAEVDLHARRDWHDLSEDDQELERMFSIRKSYLWEVT